MVVRVEGSRNLLSGEGLQWVSRVGCLLYVSRSVVIFFTGYKPFFTEGVSVVYSEFLSIHILCAGGDWLFVLYIPSIVDVQRIVVKRNNMEIKTNTLILTFNTPKIPESLEVCYLNIPVSQFVPNPLRCYRCQKFGHVTSKCKHSETCARCSETGHTDESCRKAFKCVNCGECHAAYNKKCSVYKKEYDIQSIRVSRNISFFETRQVHQNTHGQRVMSYAGATKAHRSARRLMCHGLGLSLLLGDSVLLLHRLAGHFHPSHDQWGLPLV